jgi:hypothetical protein
MLNYVPTTTEFKELTEEEKVAAYARLYKSWVAKGQVKRAATAARRRGADATNQAQDDLRERIFTEFWNRSYNDERVTAKILFASMSRDFPDPNRKLLSLSTVQRWRTILGRVWENDSSKWKCEPEAFDEFCNRVRDHRNSDY